MKESVSEEVKFMIHDLIIKHNVNFNMSWHNSEIKYVAFFNCILLRMKYLSKYDFQILLITFNFKATS